MDYLKEIALLDGEEILLKIEGNAYTTSPNPIVRFFTAIFRFLAMIFGYKLKTYLIITNKRIVKMDKETILYFIPRNVVVNTLTKNSIREVGYSQTRRWLFFKSLYFHLQSYTENINILYKGSLKELNKLVYSVVKFISE